MDQLQTDCKLAIDQLFVKMGDHLPHVQRAQDMRIVLTPSDEGKVQADATVKLYFSADSSGSQTSGKSFRR